MIARLPYVTLLCVVTITVVVATQQAPSVQAPAFRVDVNYVEQHVRVLDRSGHFVSGLSRDDFAVVEDGIPQKIDVFDLVNIPVAPPVTSLFADTIGMSVDSDVAENTNAVDARFSCSCSTIITSVRHGRH